jgi:hypothetical protein
MLSQTQICLHVQNANQSNVHIIHYKQEVRMKVKLYLLHVVIVENTGRKIK